MWGCAKNNDTKVKYNGKIKSSQQTANYTLEYQISQQT